MFELSTRLVTETFQELSAEFQTAHIYRNDVKHEESPHHLIDTVLARFCCNSTMALAALALESICIWILHNISEVCIVVLPVFCWILFVWSCLIRFGVQEVAQRMQEKPFNSSTLHRSGRGSCPAIDSICCECQTLEESVHDVMSLDAGKVVKVVVLSKWIEFIAYQSILWLVHATKKNDAITCATVKSWMLDSIHILGHA